MTSLRRKLSRKLVASCLAVACWPAIAIAQSPACDAWRGELQQIERSGGRGSPQAARAAGRVLNELNRARGAYASMSCDGLFIFAARPPQCAGLGARVNQLSAQYAALRDQAEGGLSPGAERRRGQLIAALQQNCQRGVYRVEPERAVPAQPRSLFEALFGVPTEPQQTRPGLDIYDPPEDDDRPRSWGTGRPVCVRACDGYFFPLANTPGGRGSAESMCQALCPAAETQVFYMGGDGEIMNARSGSGQPYASLANAGSYLRKFDASCSCRRPGQSWVQALAEAEHMLGQRRGDMIVTARQAEELSRPRAERLSRREQERREAERRVAAEAEAARKQDNEEQAEVEAAGRSAPTASTESSGIGQQQNVGAETADRRQGERREVITSTGERRTVRIIEGLNAPTIE